MAVGSIAEARFSHHLALEDLGGMQAVARLVHDSMPEVRVGVLPCDVVFASVTERFLCHGQLHGRILQLFITALLNKHSTALQQDPCDALEALLAEASPLGDGSRQGRGRSFDWMCYLWGRCRLRPWPRLSLVVLVSWQSCCKCWLRQRFRCAGRGAAEEVLRIRLNCVC